ncbi:hypothetical protein ACVWYN_003362 [Pedobacter sp. UYP24]
MLIRLKLQKFNVITKSKKIAVSFILTLFRFIICKFLMLSLLMAFLSWMNVRIKINSRLSVAYFNNSTYL